MPTNFTVVPVEAPGGGGEEGAPGDPEGPPPPTERGEEERDRARRGLPPQQPTETGLVEPESPTACFPQVKRLPGWGGLGVEEEWPVWGACVSSPFRRVHACIGVGRRGPGVVLRLASRSSGGLSSPGTEGKRGGA
ncbi:hypothetical protein JRQ81_011730 [Phrynocephalus forsythii]|uniref:Uncharacterized protein n=1 Tax=Phrynocephalus forsythii TaxID=171643 RepID=A0A9Q0Y1H7_9SAUR|nr:hypothetical protein JRQ81_011730 [Phrynocephalus forsythii]